MDRTKNCRYFKIEGNGLTYTMAVKRSSEACESLAGATSLGLVPLSINSPEGKMLQFDRATVTEIESVEYWGILQQELRDRVVDQSRIPAEMLGDVTPKGIQK